MGDGDRLDEIGEHEFAFSPASMSVTSTETKEGKITMNTNTVTKVVSKSNGVAEPIELPKLTRDEWRSLSKEEKAARKAARRATRGETGNAKGRALRSLVLVDRIFARLHTRLEGFGDIQAQMKMVGVSVKQIALTLEREVPTEWKPAKLASKSLRHVYAIGDVICVRAHAKKHFDGIVEESQLGTLKVVAAGEKRLIVVAADKTKFAVAVNHARLVKAVAAKKGGA